MALLTLEVMTFRELQRAFERLYDDYRADPAYLLLSEQDYAALDAEAHAYLGSLTYRVPDPIEFQSIAQIGNIVTGTYCTIIRLPTDPMPMDGKPYCHVRVREHCAPV